MGDSPRPSATDPRAARIAALLLKALLRATDGLDADLSPQRNGTRDLPTRPATVQTATHRHSILEEVAAAAKPLGTWLSGAYFAATFLSAFLLFQVQPLISKAILPWFGGAPAVWTINLLFFQLLLLGGYAYAHATSRWLSPAAQGVVHFALIALAVLFLPILPTESWKPDAGGDPAAQILRMLVVCVGTQFFLLATTAPLIQVWWSRACGGSPYRLYALSNVGSLLALVSYPFAIEPALDIDQQAWIWSLAFLLMAGLLLVCGLTAWRRTDPASALVEAHAPPAAAHHRMGSTTGDAPSSRQRLSWLLLSACGSLLLLAMTNHLCQDVAVVPFLWVAPLALYLLSFVLCFGTSSSYPRVWVVTAMGVTTYLCALTFGLFPIDNFLTVLALHLLALFAACMFCHGELVLLRPAPGHLTSFYLHMSIGGALGGIIVGIAAPVLFSDYYEYPLAMVACWLILLAVAFYNRRSPLHRGRRAWAWVLALVVFATYCGLLAEGVAFRRTGVLHSTRNFYGVLKIIEKAPGEPEEHRFILRHGITDHGAQFASEELQMTPTTYYREDSGVGQAIRHFAHRPNRRLGVVGLGVGTVAAYAVRGDYFRFYEINPAVHRYAADFFGYLTHLDQMGAEVDVVPGDARLSLEAEKDQHFDVLVLDAFSSDAIPIHLLTQEAFESYLRHLAQHGILAAHISNRFLDLVPVVRSAATRHGLEMARVDESKDERTGAGSAWVLMARPGVLVTLAGRAGVEQIGANGRAIVWTDRFSNIFHLLK